MKRKHKSPTPITFPLLCTVAVAVPSGVYSMARAQDAAPATEPEKMEKVVVTGSNIETEDAAATLNVESVDLSAPENVGRPTLADTLRTRVTQYGGGTGAVNPGFANGGDGSAQVSLRGLPQSATLLLVNGRRTSTSDLNLIPQAAIERIEILNDGASAIYGSDAVAGVVNVITKKDYNGVKVGTYYANTTETDISDWRVNALMGTTTEKSKFTASIEYSKSNEQLSKDRDRTKATSTSQTSNPGRFNRTGTVPSDEIALRWSLVPNNTRGLTNISQLPPGFNPISTVKVPAGANRQDVRDAKEAELNTSLPANSPVRYGNTPSLLPGVAEGFPFGVYTMAYRPHEQYAAYLSGEHQLYGENLEFYAEGYYAANSSENILAPSPLSGFQVPASNYWYQLLFPDAAATGAPMSVSYRPVEAGPRITYTDFENQHLVTGLRGRIAESTWHWDTGFLWDRTEIDDTQTGGILTDTYRSLLALSTPDAWNPFGYTPIGGQSSVNSAETVGSMLGEATTRTEATLLGWDFKVNGEIYKLPGGALAAAVGTEYRRETTSFEPDYAIVNQAVFPFNQQYPWSGIRDSMGGFGELLIPIFGEDFTVPAFNKFTASAAVRYEDYSDVGDTGVKPRFSFRWDPIDEQFTIRGSYAEGFTAPLMSDLYQYTQDFIELYNPYSDLREQPSDGVYTIGNPDLKPIEATSMMIGGTFQPNFLKGFSIGIDYYRIEQDNVPFESAQYIVNQWYAFDPTNPRNSSNPYGENAQPSAINPLGSRVILDDNDEILTIYDVGPVNSGKRETDGIDLRASQKIETDIGTFTLSGQATRVLTFEQEDFPGSGAKDYLGRYWGPGAVLNDTSFPEWRANIVLGYDYKRWSAAFGWNYVDAYIEDPTQQDWDGKDSYTREVRSYMTFDLRLGYKIPYIEADFMVGVNNLLDEQPPLVISSFENNYDRRVADIRGRMLFFTLSKEF